MLTFSPKVRVLFAIVVLTAVSALLAVRLSARDSAQPSTDRSHLPSFVRKEIVPSANLTAPPANVPLPRRVELDELPAPTRWSGPKSNLLPLYIQVDLDLIAPLGDGDANFALWFRDFTKSDGARRGEFDAARENGYDAVISGRTSRVLQPDDPLLLEAEDWIDQSTCRFYPDVYPAWGWGTPVPNLLAALTFSKSWIARGHEASNSEAAMEDYRRAIRLGRLLTQDDTTVIQDLVAIGCIGLGLEAAYEQARKDGDAQVMIVASQGLADVASIRHLTAQRVTALDASSHLRETWRGWKVELPPRRVRSFFEVAEGTPEGRFQMEAVLNADMLVHLSGDEDVVKRAEAAISKAASSTDPVLSSLAKWCQNTDLYDDTKGMREFADRDY